MRIALIVIAVASLIAANVANAQSGADTVKSKGCLNCHDMEKKKAGPSFKDIAAKYNGNSSAAATLVAKLKDGKGHMKVNASEADLSSAVDYVLSSK